MEDILKQIKTVPGVLGCMVCDDHGHLVSHVFPSLFDKEMLSAVIATVSQNLPGLKDFTGGVRLIDFRFQSGRIVAKTFDGGCLVILCEGTVSLQALIISVNIAIKQIEKALNIASPVVQQASAAPKAVSPVNSASPRELIERGPVSEYLQGMQTTLLKYLGPMAKIIFLECVEKWLQTNQPIRAALPHLVDIVVVEIGDPAKTAEYRQKVAAFI
jgi:predicted regulator of Ras-like GTPase activity (Roadblock/LC7/MglB family)